MDWGQCDQFPNYWVSEYGDVVSARGKGRRLKGFMSYDGYPSYGLSRPDGSKKKVPAHRLVAMTFLEKAQPGLTQIRHKNGSRIFCHHTNLAWGSPMNNRQDTVRHGTSAAKGERNPRAKLTEGDVKKIRTIHRKIKEGASDTTVKKLAEDYGVHISTICNIASGKLWPHVKLGL